MLMMRISGGENYSDDDPIRVKDIDVLTMEVSHRLSPITCGYSLRWHAFTWLFSNAIKRADCAP